MAGWNPWARGARACRASRSGSPTCPTAPPGTGTSTATTSRSTPRASRRERRALLAHELVHAERGVGYPAASTATMEREEAIVRRETALRLVPLLELDDLVARRSEVEPITAALVAEEFDVPEDVAREALLALRQRGPAGVRSSRRA